MNVYLDVGTSKIAILATEKEGALETLKAFGTHACQGLNRGMIADIDLTTQAMSLGIKDIEAQTKKKVQELVVNLSGDHIFAVASNGIVGVQGAEVSEYDVERVLEAARAVSLAANHDILHVLPLEYIVDGQGGVQRPVGMVGVRLEVKVLLVTCSSSAVQNTLRCVQKLGVQVMRVVVSHLASSAAVLTADERELGVCCVDIGAGTADIAVYHKGVVRDLSVVPVAGEHVTNDISVALRTPCRNAEKIKVEHGMLTEDSVLLDELIEVVAMDGRGGSGARVVRRQVLVDVIHARYFEIFQYISKCLKRKSLNEDIPAGIVLTGGASKMPGLVYLAEAVFKMPVRVAWPAHSALPESLQAEPMAVLAGLPGVKEEVCNALGEEGFGWSKLTKWLESYL